MRTIQLLTLTILTVSAACAQPQGTVNGIPIPNKAFAYPRAQAETTWRLQNRRAIEKEDLAAIDSLFQARRCDKLKASINGILQDQQMKEMAITVTPADIAEEQRITRVPDPQETVKRNHEHAAAILAGLDAMVNKHQDPQSVYDQYLKPHGISEEEWGVQSISGQTEEGKKALQNSLNMTVEGLAQALKNYDWSYQARNKKMKQMIDQQIALSDPKFKQYLDEYSQATDPQTGALNNMSASHLEYLNAQRAAFWKDVHRKAQVVINDPTMQNCDLSEYNGGTKPR